MKKLLMLFVMLFACCMFVACNKEEEIRRPLEEVTEINLGGSGPVEGDYAVYGTTTLKGIQLAIEEINDAGGVQLGDKKVPFKLVGFPNDGGDPTKAATNLNTLVGQNVDVVIGAVTSGATEGLIGEAVKVGVPVITPTGTADKLTVGEKGDDRANRENVFRACFYDSYQGEFMAKYAKQKGYEKAYVLFNNDDAYSVGLKDSFVKTAAAEGLATKVESYAAATKDFTTQWDKIIAEGYTCVYIPDYYQVVYTIIKAGAAAGYEGVIYGGDGWDGVTTQFNEGDQFDTAFFEQCYYTNHYFGGSDAEAVKTFVEAYKAKYNGEEPASFAALGYDAVYMVKQAIEAAGSLEYDDVTKALNDCEFSGLVTSAKSFKFVNGSPAKDAVVLTFKDGKEVEAK